MNKSLIYVTGNTAKFNIAVKALEDTGITLIQKKLETPEIQSKIVEEVAKYSAKWTSDKLNKPVMVTDAGFFIEALNGFPGPFIKYVNEWFLAEDFINLMQGKTNRTIIIQDCLAYCHPGEEPISFTGSYLGRLADKPSKNGGSPIDKIFIPEGFEVPISDIPEEEIVSYFGSGEILTKLKKYVWENMV